MGQKVREKGQVGLKGKGEKKPPDLLENICLVSPGCVENKSEHSSHTPAPIRGWGGSGAQSLKTQNTRETLRPLGHGDTRDASLNLLTLSTQNPHLFIYLFLSSSLTDHSILGIYYRGFSGEFYLNFILFLSRCLCSVIISAVFRKDQ